MLRYGWEIYQFLLKGFTKANKRFPNPQETKFIQNQALRIREALLDKNVNLENLTAEDAVKLFSQPPTRPSIRLQRRPAGIEALPLKDPKLRERAIQKKYEAINEQSRQSLKNKLASGEIKKGVFGILGFELPDENVLPMHCSAFTFKDTTNLMFGLSGTGKTTLSSDPQFGLISDELIIIIFSFISSLIHKPF